MSEDQKQTERTLADVQRDYQGMCTKAGYLQYQVYINQKDLDLVNQTLKDLNFEAAAIQAKEPKKEST